jgi:hypothetical protein
MTRFVEMLQLGSFVAKVAPQDDNGGGQWSVLSSQFLVFSKKRSMNRDGGTTKESKKPPVSRMTALGTSREDEL